MFSTGKGDRYIARFYGEIKGSAANTASRIGRDFITGHIRGWNLGAEITLFVNEDGNDELVVRVTGGSNNESGQVVYRDSTKNEEHLLDMGEEIRIVLPTSVTKKLNSDF